LAKIKTTRFDYLKLLDRHCWIVYPDGTW